MFLGSYTINRHASVLHCAQDVEAVSLVKAGIFFENKTEIVLLECE